MFRHVLRATGVGMASAATFSLAAPAAPAHAGVGCYGDYCSGRYANDVGCDSDAQTVAVNEEFVSGRLELRWSPTCKTNWARFEQYPRGVQLSQGLLMLSVEQDTGYTQTYDFGVSAAGEGTHWSPMIYSPTRKVKAIATVTCGGKGLLDTAFSCATSSTFETAAK